MSRWASAIACILILASCDSSSEPVVPEFLASPDRQWSGGEITVTATGLALGNQAVVYADGAELEILDISSSEIRARLPSDVDGTLPITVELPSGVEYDAGAIEAYGFERTDWYPLSLRWIVYEWPVAVGAAVIGGYWGEPSGVAVIGLSTGAVSRFDGIHDPMMLHAPGMGGEPDEVYLSSSWNEVSAWRLTRPPVLLWQGRPIGQTWIHWRLGPDLWLQASDDNLRTETGVPPAGPFTEVEFLFAQFGGVTEVVSLPAQGRATVAAPWSRLDLPIFDLNTGEVAARVPGLHEAYSVIALEGVGSFLIGGRRDLSDFRLLEADPTSGAILRSEPLSGYGEALLADENRDLAYLLVAPEQVDDQPRDPPRIEIRSLTAFDLLGMMEIPALEYWYARLIADEEHLYLVLTENSGEATPVPVFRLLPP